MSFTLLDYPWKQMEIGDKYEFDCNDADLNEFFIKDAIMHKRELISVTYFFYDKVDKTAISFLA